MTLPTDSPPRLTRRQAAIVSAFTGKLAGPFPDLHEYAEEKFGRPVWTHELGDHDTAEALHELARADFLAIAAQEDPPAS